MQLATQNAVTDRDVVMYCFSIGNVKPLFAAAFPDCWGKHPTTCNETWIQAVDYLEVIGIIVGQILVGILGDWLGRRWGLIQDATIMFLGLIMLTASWGVTTSKYGPIRKDERDVLIATQTAGSSATYGPSGFTVLVWAASIP